MNQDDYWDCPCCGQPTQPEHDKECHCGMMVSHHVSTSTMCKRLRESQQRESALIVKNKKLEDEVNEQARLLGKSGERECDLRGKIDRLERDLENRRDLFKLQEHLMDELKEQLAAERAIADRLAKSIMNWKSEQWRGTPEKATEQVMSALAAWKEARGE